MPLNSSRLEPRGFGSSTASSHRCYRLTQVRDLLVHARLDFRYAPSATEVGGGALCREGPRPCEKALTLDHDRTSYSPKAAFGAHTQADSSLRPNPENVILVALRLFAFSHSLGPNQTSTWFLSGVL